MIRAVNVSIVPLSSHTCTGLVALLPPARKAGRNRHTKTLVALVCLVSTLREDIAAWRLDLYESQNH